MSNRVPAKNYDAIKKRSGGTCERCRAFPAREPAHRIPRDVGGHLPSNIAHLCSSDPTTGRVGCHQWSTDNPTASYLEGWTVRRDRRVKPHHMPEIPARRTDGTWVTFTTVINADDSVESETVIVPEGHALEVLDSFGITPLEVAV